MGNSEIGNPTMLEVNPVLLTQPRAPRQCTFHFRVCQCLGRDLAWWGMPLRQQRTNLLRLWCLLGLLCFHTSSLLAIDPQQSILQMQHTAWSAKQGVIGEVLAIAQTSDGFLWIGTTGGLLRFDGTL